MVKGQWAVAANGGVGSNGGSWAVVTVPRCGVVVAFGLFVVMVVVSGVGLMW